MTPTIWRTSLNMTRLSLNPLNARGFLRFPRTPWDAIISLRDGAKSPGPGHNATTVSKSAVVPRVVGKSSCRSKAYHPPTTLQRSNHIPLHACMRVCACVYQYLFHRCTVVSITYPIDINRIIPTTLPTTHPQNGLKSVVSTVVALANPLKNNKKGGFYGQG